MCRWGLATYRPEMLNNAPGMEPLLSGIARLKAEQANLRAERKRVQKELKNAEKRRVRLRKRARQLSDQDLVAVLQMRESAAAPPFTSAREDMRTDDRLPPSRESPIDCFWVDGPCIALAEG